MAGDSVPHFDAALGGENSVPPLFNLREFGDRRIEEILMLSEVLSSPSGHNKGQIFQRLPKHMRRRQMSHHNSRLPRRLRDNIANNKPHTEPSKRPSRKFRRKPVNLLSDYKRRQRAKVWLETHIWHAKRFHMTEKWGYKLPKAGTNKGFRANYRAIRSHCLLMDLSYLNCVQLSGTEPDLLNGLSKCTQTACGLTFAAKFTLDGQREGRLPLFHPDSNSFIGNVTFMWKPETTERRQLWIWCHPAFHQEVVECLCQMFDLKQVEKSCLPSYSSEQVTLTLLKDRLNRYRLVGPLSSCVVADALQVARVPKLVEVMEVDDDAVVVVIDESIQLNVDEANPKRGSQLASKLETLDNAIATSYMPNNLHESWEKQKQLAESLKKCPPSHYPSGAVLGLLIQDPRMNFPEKRTKSILKDEETPKIKWNENLPTSLIWDVNIRETATSCKPTDWEIYQQRSEMIVPSGTHQAPTATLPILLVQQRGSTKTANYGLGAGWDVIVPSGWGLPLWRALVYRGGRTGALREAALLDLEMGSLRLFLPPDSKSGKEESTCVEKMLQEKYFKLPPAKRPNYIKLGFYRPFTAPWDQICKGEPHVIRNGNLLRQISEAVANKQPLDLKDIPNGLVAVVFRCTKGRPENLARVHLPVESDIATKDDISEPAHVDNNQSLRKSERTKHKSLLKQWRRDRKRKKNGEETKWEESEVKTLRENYHDTQAKLWLRESPAENIREVVGCLVQADFSFSEGCGAALGYVTLQSIAKSIQLAKKSTPMLLLRNVNMSEYLKSTYRVVLD